MHGPVRDRVDAVTAWARFVAVLLARGYRALLLTLAAVAVLPLLVGWTSYVVHSGSMEPAIAVGDVTVAKPISADGKLPVGRVMVFDDPSTDPERNKGRMVHRVVERLDDGMFVTAGDANEVTDSTHLPRSAFTEQAVLLVPYVGLPVTWAHTGRWLHLLLWLVATTAAFWLATRDLLRGTGAGDGDGEDVEDARGPGHRAPGRSRGPVGVGTAFALAGLLVTPLLVPASATFTARTSNGSSSWQTGRLLLPYTAAVLEDDPELFWLLDEDGGSVAADRSGNGETGQLVGVDAYGVPNGLPQNPGTAVRLGGDRDRIVAAGPAQGAPRSFTMELWFRKDGGPGGRIMGFESSRDAWSWTYDRLLYIRNNGRLVYGTWSTFGSPWIESDRSYDDGRWHHLAVAVTGDARSSTAAMYVDGEQVASGPTMVPEAYLGWWRVGYGSMPTFSFNHPSAALSADIDNVAVYPAALSAERIRAHYAAR